MGGRHLDCQQTYLALLSLFLFGLHIIRSLYSWIEEMNFVERIRLNVKAGGPAFEDVLGGGR